MKRFLGLLICSAVLFSCGDDSKTEEKADAKAGTETTSAQKDYEIGDSKLVDIAKKHLGYLEKGDIDAWMGDFSDDAIFRWNNLDSLLGKPAITDYWKKRRTDVIDSMSFAADIWMPVKVNKSQGFGQLTGDYVLSWYLVTAKYKTGKSMTQRIHNIYHFNANGKIDRLFQYLDKAPIIAAMTK